MNFKDAVKLASEIAYEDYADQIVASNDMKQWFIFHLQDTEAKAYRHWIYVSEDGVLQTDLTAMLEMAGIEGDQDWEKGITIWTLPCETRINATGSMVEFE